MANKFEKIVDCRMVQFEVEFFMLTKSQVKSIAEYFLSKFACIFSNEFFQDWKLDGKKSNLNDILQKLQICNGKINFSCTADVLSPIIFNRLSYNKYDKQLFEPNDPKTWHHSSVSYDYCHFLNKLLPDLNDYTKSKEAVMKLFYEPNKAMQAVWRDHDSSLLFMSYPYTDNQDIFRGVFEFSIALQCLIIPQKFANSIIKVAIDALTISENINARIALSPITSPSPCSAHMIYFGGSISEEINIPCDISLGIRTGEWFPYYYIRGAEWFNLLSPLVSFRLPQLASTDACFENVEISKFSNGTITVKSRKDIEKIDTCDLYNVRLLLYPVLYPGRSRIDLKNLNNPNAFGYLAKPRQQWEYLPLFDNEVFVDNQSIYFIYNKKGQRDGLRQP